MSTASPALAHPAPSPAAELPAGPRRSRLSGTTLLALTAALITASTIAAYLNGRGGIDLAIFDQGLFVASRHLTMPASIIRETVFEDHFAPGMLAFAALYRIVATPLWLLVGQGVAAFAAAKLVADRLRPNLGDRQSAWVGVALLISPPVAYCLLWDVHFIVMAVPFALAAAFALEDGHPRRALPLALLAALFRIDVGLGVLAAFAVMPGSRKGRLRPAALLFAYLMAAEYFEQKLGHAIFWPMHYAHLGTGPVDAVTNPLRVISTLISWRALAKALPWLATGAFLCLRRPRLAVVAAVVALPVLLSHWPGTDQFFFQYGYAPTFLLALAWIPLARSPERAKWVIAASTGLGLLLGPVLPALIFPGFGYSYAASRFVPDREVQCMVRNIPSSAGVSTTSSPLSLLAERDVAYLWPFPFAPAPAGSLPGPQHRQAVPELAQEVDYLIVPRDHGDPIPAGFTEDGATDKLLRFRRAATTVPAPRPCRP
ncbi:MAG TPA: DUF2079 domain-containing protein [Acidimicrobiia bacterium]|nr:DUF2079 domain-containing protein [Acidimicrobiia bacterium]